MKFAGRSYYQAIFLPACYFFFFLSLWMAFKMVVEQMSSRCFQISLERMLHRRNDFFNFSYLTKTGFCFRTNTLITRLLFDFFFLLSFKFLFKDISRIFLTITCNDERKMFLNSPLYKTSCNFICLFLRNDRKQNNLIRVTR